MKSKKKKPLKEKTTTAMLEDSHKIRKRMMEKVFRRDDGILQCPTAYAQGYGIQDAKSGL